MHVQTPLRYAKFMKKLLLLTLVIPLSIFCMDPNEPVDPQEKLKFLNEYSAKQTAYVVLACISSAIGYYGYKWGVKKQKQFDDYIIDVDYRSPKEIVEPSMSKKLLRSTGRATYFTFLKLVPGFVVLPTAAFTISAFSHMHNDYVTYQRYCTPEKPRSTTDS